MLLFQRKNLRAISRYVFWYILILVAAFIIDVCIWMWFERDSSTVVNEHVPLQSDVAGNNKAY